MPIQRSSGQHFVYWLALQRKEDWIYDTIPRDYTASIAADWEDDDRFFIDVLDALAPLSACLVPNETRIEWTKDGRRYSIRGDSVCVSTLDEMRTTCHGFISVGEVTIEDDGHRVTLRYPGQDDRGGFITGLLRGWDDQLVDVPDAFEFDDPETGREFARLIRETLTAYRPTTKA